MEDEEQEFAAAFGSMNDQEPEIQEPETEQIVEEETQPEPVIVEPEPEQPKPEAQHVPITALLDERDKRRTLEQELERLRASQQPTQQPSAPDMFDDPEGYASYQSAMTEQTAINTKLDISEEMARDKFGDEEVEAAKNWALSQFQSRPDFQRQVLTQRHPYKFAVEAYRREQMVSQVTPDDFAQFKAWQAAQSQIQAQTKPAPQAPPRSLASAPSAGGILTEVLPSEEEDFEAAFARK